MCLHPMRPHDKGPVQNLSWESLRVSNDREKGDVLSTAWMVYCILLVLRVQRL